MKRRFTDDLLAIYWRFAAGAMKPIYGVGPWWAHLVFWLARYATALGLRAADWAERRMLVDARRRVDVVTESREGADDQ